MAREMNSGGHSWQVTNKTFDLAARAVKEMSNAGRGTPGRVVFVAGHQRAFLERLAAMHPTSDLHITVAGTFETGTYTPMHPPIEARSRSEDASVVGFLGDLMVFIHPLIGVLTKAAGVVLDLHSVNQRKPGPSDNPYQILADALWESAAMTPVLAIVDAVDLAAESLASLLWVIAKEASSPRADRYPITLFIGLRDAPHDLTQSTERYGAEVQYAAALCAEHRADWWWIDTISSDDILRVLPEISPDLADLLVALGEGDPYVIEELLTEWIGRGHLRRDSVGRWMLNPTTSRTSVLLGSRFHKVIEQLVQSPPLAMAVSSVLEVGAIEGDTFDLTAAAMVTGQDPEEVTDQVDDLLIYDPDGRPAGILDYFKAGDGWRYRFRLPWMRSWVASTVDAETRRAISATLASTLQTLHPGADRTTAMTIARLARAGGLSELADFYSGLTARMVSDVVAAVESKFLAIYIDTNVGTRSDLEARVTAQRFFDLGKSIGANAPVVAAEAFTAGIRLSSECDMPELAGDLYLWLGAVERMVGEFDNARRHLTFARDLALERGFPLLHAASERDLGIVDRVQRRDDTARQHYEVALRVYRSLGDRQGVADVLNELGVLNAFQNMYTAAHSNFDEVLRMCRQATGGITRHTQADALHGSALVSRDEGDYVAARQHYTGALEVFRSEGHLPGISETLQGLGNVEYLEGHLEQARRYYLEALPLTRQLGDPAQIAYNLYGLGSVEEDAGRYDLACTYFNEALDSFVVVGLHSRVADIERRLTTMTGN